MFFSFPEDPRWKADRQAVEFGVEIGEYHGVVRVPRRVFQRLLPERPTPERCVEAYSYGGPASSASPSASSAGAC
jgi:hypothetical protein